jgi:hypothetical protein
MVLYLLLAEIDKGLEISLADVMNMFQWLKISFHMFMIAMTAWQKKGDLKKVKLRKRQLDPNKIIKVNNEGDGD